MGDEDSSGTSSWDCSSSVVEGLPSVCKVLSSVPQCVKMAVLTYNSTTQETEAGRLRDGD